MSRRGQFSGIINWERYVCSLTACIEFISKGTNSRMLYQSVAIAANAARRNEFDTSVRFSNIFYHIKCKLRGHWFILALYFLKAYNKNRPYSLFSGKLPCVTCAVN